MDIFTDAFVSFLAAFMVGIFSWLIKELVEYVKSKREDIVEAIGEKKYNRIHNIAKAAYYAAEQTYKNESNAGEEKANFFDSIIASKIPELSISNIANLRESIVGELNSTIKKEVFNDDMQPIPDDYNTCIADSVLGSTEEEIEIPQEEITSDDDFVLLYPDEIDPIEDVETKNDIIDNIVLEEEKNNLN